MLLTYFCEETRFVLSSPLHFAVAILAATTTSLPERIGGTRNWDYRYCWLRDAYFALSTFQNLGHFEEMEGFLKFLLNIAYTMDLAQNHLSPVYTLTHDLPVPETEHHNWQGCFNSRPVRSCNQAAEHVQNDVYGEMILTLAPIFFDNRFIDLRTSEHEALVAKLVHRSVSAISQQDAGIWENRNGWKEHSFTNLMCWDGLDRADRMERAGLLSNLSLSTVEARSRAEWALEQAARNGALRNGPSDDSFDAALAQAAILGFPNRIICEATAHDIIRELVVRDGEGERGFFYRYLREDDFGRPPSRFCYLFILDGTSAGQTRPPG